MKRKRNSQGKFTRKNLDYRQVRSLRLTDTTWKAFGIASECLGITRADFLENLAQQNLDKFLLPDEIEQLWEATASIHQENSLKKEQLTFLSKKVLEEMRLGKQSNNYKLAQKVLKRLIELASLYSE